MRALQSVMAGIGGELDVTEEGGEIGGVERRRDFRGIERSGRFDGALENDAAGVAWSGMVIGRRLEFGLESLGEFLCGRPEIRLVGNMQFPLRRRGNAERGRAQIRELIVGGCD